LSPWIIICIVCESRDIRQDGECFCCNSCGASWPQVEAIYKEETTI
jgi:hypothetical protein